MDRRQHDDGDGEAEFEDRIGDQRTAPFSRHERRQIRDIIDRDSKARWLAATVRAWGAWLAALLAAVLLFSENLRKAFKGWLS